MDAQRNDHPMVAGTPLYQLTAKGRSAYGGRFFLASPRLYTTYARAEADKPEVTRMCRDQTQMDFMHQEEHISFKIKVFTFGG
jgi:hypothetical protein